MKQYVPALILAFTGTAACSNPPREISTEAGTYEVQSNHELDLATLPSNADLKMSDGDIARYAITLCGLDYAHASAIKRCEVFLQADKSALLVGYVALIEDNDVRIETAITTDRERSGTGCFLSGIVENSDYERLGSKVEISQNFKARLPFFAWERSPGDWMVSSEAGDKNSAGGVWYITRINDNLRISQERWNYCYKDSQIFIDEVFVHAITLLQKAS